MAADIPRDLRVWRRVDPPRHKKDYADKLVQAPVMPARREYDLSLRKYVDRPESLVPDGAVLTLHRRDTLGNGKASLECWWPCPCCGHKHVRTFDEADIAEGRLFFVEEERGGMHLDPGQYLYLASPYDDPDYAVMERRWLEAAAAVAWLITGGGNVAAGSGTPYTVYSPVVVEHPVRAMGARLGVEVMPWANWAHLDAATAFIVLQIDGWQQSATMREDLGYARKRGLPVWSLRPDGEIFMLALTPNLQFEEAAHAVQ